MIIRESFEVFAAKGDVVAFLLDVERMSMCVPGVEGVRALEDDEYEATLRMQLGPIRSQFVGRARLDTANAPDHLVASAEGRDRSSGSQVQVVFQADVTEHPGPRTVVECTADVTIRGRLGQFGTGLITSTAKSVLREFASCAGEVLGATGSGTGSGGPEHATPSTARIARRSMGIYMSDLPSRVGAKFRRGPDGEGDRSDEPERPDTSA